MKYKLTDNGNIVVKDEKPVVIDDDGKEFVVDAIGASENVRAAKKEAKKYRLELKEVTDKFEKYKPIEDPKAAIEALQTVGSLSDQHKLDIEKLKKGMNDTWTEKIQEKEAKITDLENELYKETVTNKFVTSKVVKGLLIPPDIAAVYFGKNFQKDGTAKDSAGNLIYSKEKPGEPAGFEEALDFLVEAYPDKDSIKKGTGTKGSGGHGSGSGGDGGTEQKTSRENISAGLKERGIG
jgi:hypothetical protein